MKPLLQLRFFVDPRTAEPHIFQHSVSEEEVAEALHHVGEDRPGREGSRVAIGATGSGRFLNLTRAAGASQRPRLVEPGKGRVVGEAALRHGIFRPGETLRRDFWAVEARGKMRFQPGCSNAEHCAHL